MIVENKVQSGKCGSMEFLLVLCMVCEMEERMTYVGREKEERELNTTCILWIKQ